MSKFFICCSMGFGYLKSKWTKMKAEVGDIIGQQLKIGEYKTQYTYLEFLLLIEEGTTA